MKRILSTPIKYLLPVSLFQDLPVVNLLEGLGLARNNGIFRKVLGAHCQAQFFHWRVYVLRLHYRPAGDIARVCVYFQKSNGVK